MTINAPSLNNAPFNTLTVHLVFLAYHIGKVERSEHVDVNVAARSSSNVIPV